MCGVIAKFGNNLALPKDLLAHRGPDAQSVYVHNHSYINYFQLAITGVSEGKTPVVSKDGSIQVFINGEIYNHKKLNDKYMLDAGTSDMHVLAEGVSKIGIEFLSELRGMFAGIVVDTSRNRYFIVRDALGEKPLFMVNQGNDLYVASEFMSILSMIDRPLKLRHESVESFLRLNYVEEPFTFDKEINHVPKGSVLEVDVLTGTCTRVLLLQGYSAEDATRTLDGLIEEILSETLSTEVATGLALSGGLDSNALLIAASKYDSNCLTALTLTDGLNNSESDAASANAMQMGIPCDVLTCNFPASDEEFHELVTAMDQPIADPSSLSYFRIFKEAHSLGKKVVLLGHGPDEFFWGYPWYFSKLESLRYQVDLPEIVFTPASSTRLLKILRPKFKPGNKLNSEDPFMTSPDPSKYLRARMVHGYLTSNGFAQLDRLAMHFSIEPRVPFADSRIYGWAQSNSIVGHSKSEFKAALDIEALPGLLERTKTGFTANLTLWFQNQLKTEVFSVAYKEVFGIKGLWYFRIPKIFLSHSDRYKILVLGTWLHSLDIEAE